LERSPLYQRREHAARLAAMQARVQAWHYVDGETRQTVKVVTDRAEVDRVRR
jgi:hypothetical protein